MVSNTLCLKHPSIIHHTGQQRILRPRRKRNLSAIGNDAPTVAYRIVQNTRIHFQSQKIISTPRHPNLLPSRQCDLSLIRCRQRALIDDLMPSKDNAMRINRSIILNRSL